jgi:tetratricopeptide (TPR) repeat protein
MKFRLSVPPLSVPRLCQCIAWIALCSHVPRLPAQAAPQAQDEMARAADLMTEGDKLLAQRTPDSLHASITKHQQALELWEKLGQKARQPEALADIAIAHSYLHEPADALTFFSCAAEVANASGDHAAEAFSRTSMAIL